MYTAGEISIEHVNVFLGTYISKDAIHMTFLSATTHLHLPGGWQEIHLKNFPIHGSIHYSFNYMKSATSRREPTPCHDVSTSKLRVMHSAMRPKLNLLAVILHTMFGGEMAQCIISITLYQQWSLEVETSWHGVVSHVEVLADFI